MDLSNDRPKDVPLEADAPAQAGVVGLFVDCVRRPRTAMAELAQQRVRLWLVPTVALAVFSLTATIVSLPAKERYDMAVSAAQMKRLAERNPSAFGNQDPEAITEMATSSSVRTVSRLTALAGSAAGPFVAALVIAALVHLLATLLGGQQTFGQMLVATSWARLPLVFQAALRSVVWGATGSFDPVPDGLAGLVASPSPQEMVRPSVWGPLLALVSIWNLWMLLLLLLAVVVVTRLSLRKGLAVVFVYLALLLALGEMGVMMGRFAMDLTVGGA